METKKITYDEFKKASKWLMKYKEMNIFKKCIFNLSLPIKYRAFKKVMKKTKVVKGDVIK
jgi:hypothetical protein